MIQKANRTYEAGGVGGFTGLTGLGPRPALRHRPRQSADVLAVARQDVESKELHLVIVPQRICRASLPDLGLAANGRDCRFSFPSALSNY
jgi:hypothetical protein